MSAGSEWPRIAHLLLQNERALLAPEVRRNREQVSQYLAQDFREFGSSGAVWTREQTLDLLANQPIPPLEIEDFDCRQLAVGVALVTYLVVRPNPQTNQRTTTLRSSLWIIEEGQWRLFFHQGTHQAPNSSRDGASQT